MNATRLLICCAFLPAGAVALALPVVQTAISPARAPHKAADSRATSSSASAASAIVVPATTRSAPDPFQLDHLLPAEHAHQLSPTEEKLAQSPFASEAARRRLRRIDRDLQTPPRMPHALKAQMVPDPERNDMDFRLPDRLYWRTIPPEAAHVPDHWDQYPTVKFRNTEIGGRRDISLRQTPHFDQWLLQDYAHKVSACISVERSSHRIYFAQFRRTRNGWAFKAADDNCYSCHPSGPRVIRPFLDPIVNRARLSEFDRLILSYGSCSYGDSIDLGFRGHALPLQQCASCHNGADRGILYQIHIPTIHFKEHSERTMPPV